MKVKILMILCAICLMTGKAQAQWVTFDPSNLTQGIINATKNITQTTTTAKNMVSNFQETKKIFDQGKQYYDGAPI